MSNITEDGNTGAAHQQNVSVLQSNIIFCDIFYMISASLLVSSSQGFVNC